MQTPSKFVSKYFFRYGLNLPKSTSPFLNLVLLLFKLTEILNRIHKVNYKTTDWDKFIGWWLFYFISVVFDRWENIRIAEENFKNLETICLKFNEIEITATNTNDFNKKASSSDEWNSYMFNKIIDFRGVTKINRLNKSLLCLK